MACRHVNTAPLLVSNGCYAYALQRKGIFEVSFCPTTGIGRLPRVPVLALSPRCRCFEAIS